MLKATIKLYFDHNIPKSAAALSYHLTMTFFPLLICLYALFGQNYLTALRVFGFVKQFLTEHAANLIHDYLLYVARSSGQPILIAAVTLLFTSASAVIRVIESTIAEMQGGHRFRAWIDMLFSFALAVALLFTMYFALMVMITGHDAILLLQRNFPQLGIGLYWMWLRFILLAGIVFLLQWGVFSFSNNGHYRTLPGAAASTLGIVGMTQLFSIFISASARYSLVYGSLASFVLLMLWSYFACQITFFGAALNIALKDHRSRA